MTDSFSKVSLWSVDFSIFIHESGCKKFPIIISSSTESPWIHYHRKRNSNTIRRLCQLFQKVRFDQ
jgi:hypothetical protein